MAKLLAMARSSSVALEIRELILQGQLKPGERVKELELAERLGVSRTPIRAALPALAEEGLLVAHGARGYAVRQFSQADSLHALHARAALEGLAARALARSAALRPALDELAPLLRAGDEIVHRPQFSAAMELDYAEMNGRFHAVICARCGVELLADLIARCNVAPFVAPSTVAFDDIGSEEKRALLIYAHRQHHSIVEALAAGDGARAEALLREHAYAQEHSMRAHAG